MNRSRVALSAIVGLALLGACTTENDSNSTEGTPPPGDVSVEVLLDEFTIEMPDSIAGGTVSFEAANNGEMEHSFAIEGEGLETRELEATLAANETATLTVDLEPGTYTVWCPVGDHREQGMETTIEVTEAEGGGGQNLSDEGVGPSESQSELDEDS